MYADSLASLESDALSLAKALAEVLSDLEVEALSLAFVLAEMLSDVDVLAALFWLSLPFALSAALSLAESL